MEQDDFVDHHRSERVMTDRTCAIFVLPAPTIDHIMSEVAASSGANWTHMIVSPALCTGLANAKSQHLGELLVLERARPWSLARPS